MRALLQQFRRAPGRILASVFALALAVGAIGVLAIPSVAGSALDEAVERDGLADIVMDTTPLDPEQVALVATLPNVAAVEAQTRIAVDDGDRTIRLIGVQAGRTMDRVTVTAGREARFADEVVAEIGTFDIGDALAVGDQTFTVVGVGSTLWWSGFDAVYGDLVAVTSLAPDNGTDRLTVTALDDGEAALRALADDIRVRLAADGDTFRNFPEFFADGTTPIHEDITQVSQLIGLLGIFAGFVAMVLLASTTNTLIAERTRETAVLRALGGRQKPLRRRLRRIAATIAVAALVLGLPLGVAISNFIARMVLEEFVGITPDVGVAIPVLIGSTVGVLVAARLVSARAARRVTVAPLADALRDRDGAPFGSGLIHRTVSRIRLGGLMTRIAARTPFRRPGRSVAISAQIAAAVGAAFLVPTLVTSVNDYNTAAFSAWNWEAQATAQQPGLPVPIDSFDRLAETEAGINVSGTVDDWELDVYGIADDSIAIDAELSAGRWLKDPADAVVSSGFAERNRIELGSTIEVQLASGIHHYAVVGLADDASRAVYVERNELAVDLGSPGMANVGWSLDPTTDLDAVGADLGVPIAAATMDEIAAEEAAGTNAIVLIFGAIGAIVGGVAALAVVSSMTVNLYERRHELAALQALGARRRRLRSLLVRELIPLGSIGLAAGLGLGALGARAIIASFESSNAIDIGVTDALGAIPAITIATGAMLFLVAAAVVHGAARRPIAVNVRGAA